MKVYINGEYLDTADAKISVFDHGLLYGDGVFEGIRLYQGCVFKLDEHLERLEMSAKAIMLKIPLSRSELSEAVCESCRRNGIVDGYVRLVVTRGIGDLGLSPKLCETPQVIIIADKIQLYPEAYYTEGMKVMTVATWRNNPAALPPMIKSLNYLNNIMAKMDAQNAGYVEALMLNDRGCVAECTGDNIFIFFKEVIYTTPNAAGNLRGITRQVAKDIAGDMGIRLEEAELTRYDLWNAEECFLTGTAAEIVPVTEIDGREIGSGKPGPTTLRFIEAFRKKVSVEGTML